MKKTLAAVLAAAMALSTATVAFATDIEVDFTETSGSVSGFREVEAKMGDTSNFRITKVTTEDGDVIDGAELARAMDEGDVTASVIVTNNAKALDGKPSLIAGNYRDDSTRNPEMTISTKYVWADDVEFKINGKTFKGYEGREITEAYLYVDGAGQFAILVDDNYSSDLTVYHAKKGDKNLGPNKNVTFAAAIKEASTTANGSFIETKAGYTDQDDTKGKLNQGIQLKFKINHTYGTDSVTVGMKLRFTARRDTIVDGIDLKKGDTLTSEQVNFKAEYNELSNYYRDMQLTTQEVSDNNVLLKGSSLYDKIGNETFSITFGDDVAMFTGKAAANQKTVNLYYSLGEIDEIKNAYPDVDFQFITFKGNPAPTFAVTGEMVFAAWDKDTTVYSWDGEVLEPMGGKYDPTYKTITVSGIKRLGTYVIASEILEVEEEPEEPAEPVDSTPVAEPDNDEGGNPNTGAC